MYSVSLTFKRHMQDDFFDLTNRVTTSFTLVGNEADSRDIDPVAILAYTRAGALSLH
jgi:hypothetical protein